MTALLLLAACGLSGEPVELPIDKHAVVTVDLKGFPDWMELGSGSLWVSNPGTNAVQRIDPAIGKVMAEVKVNKPVAAMAALHLVEQGKLSLDSDVNQALTSWKIPPSAAAPDAVVTRSDGKSLRAVNAIAIKQRDRGHFQFRCDLR